MELHIPDDADSEEAAAIAAVVRRLTAETETERGDTSENVRDRWQFVGRIEALQNRRVRVRDGSSTDDWRMAGRTDRL